ncbi:MAG: pyrimidine utilization protein D [Rhodocyclaceae bacterium]|nr:pyrimidine utilization protein D [Pseudomonadota bacterium]MDQ7975143.1 pyrimidine utilization protein D [Rhodocyclaceae bacterium]MDQ7999965.1 pyrimidine utilization protein D [Pseudomonadota bacterium]MDQ8015471.1 pyrimidine utilization protein D [Pseudomonadota bacterium]
MALYHEVHGDGRPGMPSVLLSSGLGGSAGFWRPQIPALVEAGWRVVAYDQRGTGRSPADLPAGYAIADMARDVAEVMKTTGTERCHLVGHALGGLVGLQLALDAPHSVASLVLVNAWSRPNPHSARCFDARLALLGACGPRAYVEAQPIFLYPADWAAAHASEVQAEVDHAFAHFPGEANMRARIGALRAFDVDARLAQIAAPTLVACAQDDVLVPWTMSLHLAERLRFATLDRSAHGGHAHSVTDPARFNAALLAFLARQH